jgi:hypothetical protein
VPEWKTSYSSGLAVWAATLSPITLTAPSKALANFSSGVKADFPSREVLSQMARESSSQPGR